MTIAQTIASGVIAALGAVLVGWWARKGQDGASAAALAGSVMEQLDHRVQRLEVVHDWQLIVAGLDRDHIGELRQWIFDERPPPPPPRPTYPPRPA